MLFLIGISLCLCVFVVNHVMFRSADKPSDQPHYLNYLNAH